MANSSIYAAFERMWQHVIAALGKKADKTDIVQSDWVQNDEAALDYVKNRTHWVEEGNIVETKYLTEKTDGLGVKLNDPEFAALLLEYRENAKYYVNHGFGDIEYFYDSSTYNEEGKSWCVVTDNPQGHDTIIEIRDGIILSDDYPGENRITSITISIAHNGEIIHQLDPKYIKDMYYEEDPIEVEILPETIISGFELMEGSIYYVENAFIMDKPTVGQIFNVHWDGTEYEAAYEEIEEGFGFIGNENYVDMSPGGSFPFSIIYAGGTIFVTTESTASSHTIAITTTETVVHQIDHKYIKDMYHDNGIIETEIASNITVEITEGFINGILSYMLQEGATYIVTWNGEEYECLARDFGDGGGLYIGNQSLTNGWPYPEFIKSNEPFIIYTYAPENYSDIGAESGTHTFSIVEKIHDIKQLDNKYLSILEDDYKTVLEIEDFPSHATVEDPSYKKLVGEFRVTIDNTDSKVIEFIDEGDSSYYDNEDTFEIVTFNGSIYIWFQDGESHSVKIEESCQVIKKEHLPEDIGVQSDWNQNDPEAKDYVKNKTHWEEIVEDGVLFEGKIEGSAGTFVDLGIQLDLEQDKQYKVIVNGIEHILTSYWSDTDGDTISFADIGFGCYLHDTPDGVENSAIWTNDNISFTLKLIDPEKEKIIVHQLDPKYIKDMYYEDPTKEEINVLINTKVNIPSAGGYALLNNTLPMLIIGDTYIVTLNGTEYECTARVDPNHNNGALLGNGTIYGDGNIGNGEPFAIDSHENNTIYLNTESAGDYTVSISHLGYVIHKIDSKYLNNVMSSRNPSGTGSFSLNRNPNSNIGANSVAHGYNTIASGSNTHAEGFNTTASGNVSHAEGGNTIASANFSHAEGYNTIAQRRTQHVQGEFNIPDTSGDKVSVKGDYIHIVGNGTADNARSNAHTLDWDGNAWYQGDVYVGSTSGTNKDEGSKKLATEEYVNSALEEAGGDGSGIYVQETEPENPEVGDIWIDTSDGIATEIQPLSILQGGTGANTAEEARTNLEAAPAFSLGATILTSFQYGDTLPEEATLGRVFFKKA